MRKSSVNQNIKKIGLTIILFIVMALIGFKFIKHEKAQEEKILKLNASIEELNVRLNNVEKKDIAWSNSTYNYFAIGNSITLHSECDYWWSETGMAASSQENDYVHQLVQLIEKEEQQEVVFEAYNFSIWEVNANDRAEFLPILDNYLDKNIDLITIQLGENVTDITTFESDFTELINYIHDSAPNAVIVAIGDFWEKEGRDEVKESVANACGIRYISLNEIKENEEYECGIGTEVFDLEGKTHIVNHFGVAKHPGDKGMKWIAEAVFYSLK